MNSPIATFFIEILNTQTGKIKPEKVMKETDLEIFIDGVKLNYKRIELEKKHSLNDRKGALLISTK